MNSITGEETAKVGSQPRPLHTPGPWIADSLYMQHDRVVRISAYDGKPGYYHRCMSIAECHVRESRSDNSSPNVLQAEANARLIAAAPELFEALKEAQKRLEMIDGNDEPAVALRILIGGALAAAVGS